MNYLFLLYIGDIVPSLGVVLGIGACFLIVGSILWHAIQYDNAQHIDWEEEKIHARKRTKNCLLIATIAIFISAFLPSKQFIYTAVALKAGAKITQEIKDNPLVSKGFKVLEKYLDEELTDPSNAE